MTTTSRPVETGKETSQEQPLFANNAPEETLQPQQGRPQEGQPAELQLPEQPLQAEPQPQQAQPQPAPPQAPLPTAQPSPQQLQQAAVQADLRRQTQQAQRLQEDAQARYNEMADAQEAQQFEKQLATEFPGADLSKVTGQYRALLRQTRAAEQQVRMAQRQSQEQVANMEAKIQVAQNFAEQYGMPFRDLMRYDSPQLMEAEAKGWKAQSELSRLRQSGVQPNAPTSGAPSRARVSITPDNIDALWLDGKIPDDLYRTFRETGTIAQARTG